MDLGVILQKYRRGDHLTSTELEALRDSMERIKGVLEPFGDLFDLPCSYAAKVHWDCRAFLRARAERQS